MNKYFYDKKTGEYTGMTNDGGACPSGCIESVEHPEEYGKKKSKGYDKKQPKSNDEKRNAYAQKIAAYSDRQIQGALIRAKGFKHGLLTAEKAAREQ